MPSEAKASHVLYSVAYIVMFICINVTMQ